MNNNVSISNTIKYPFWEDTPKEFKHTVTFSIQTLTVFGVFN